VKGCVIKRKSEGSEMKINRRRKRAIAKAVRELEHLENFKEHLRAVGASYKGKGKDGKHYGTLRFD
jgi:uncharacterized protein (UPF0128 family)